MDNQSTSNDKQEKQITVDVPEDRVAEFYAWYGRFLSRSERGRGRRHGHGHGHGCGCGSRSERTDAEPTVAV